jgi:hypothetical protein
MVFSTWILKRKGYQCLGFKCKLSSQDSPFVIISMAIVLFPKFTASWLLTSVLFMDISQLNYVLSLSLTSKVLCFYKLSVHTYDSIICMFCCSLSRSKFHFLTSSLCRARVHVSSCTPGSGVECHLFNSQSLV